MRQTVPLGRVAGIRVGAHWSVLVMVVMIGWLLGGQVLPGKAPGQPAAAYWAVAVPCAVAFMAALLAHELAHSPGRSRARLGAQPSGDPGQPPGEQADVEHVGPVELLFGGEQVEQKRAESGIIQDISHMPVARAVPAAASTVYKHHDLRGALRHGQVASQADDVGLGLHVLAPARRVSGGAL
jgi:hypothetical protein